MVPAPIDDGEVAGLHLRLRGAVDADGERLAHGAGRQRDVVRQLEGEVGGVHDTRAQNSMHRRRRPEAHGRIEVVFAEPRRPGCWDRECPAPCRRGRPPSARARPNRPRSPRPPLRDRGSSAPSPRRGRCGHGCSSACRCRRSRRPAARCARRAGRRFSSTRDIAQRRRSFSSRTSAFHALLLLIRVSPIAQPAASESAHRVAHPHPNPLPFRGRGDIVSALALAEPPEGEACELECGSPTSECFSRCGVSSVTSTVT